MEAAAPLYSARIGESYVLGDHLPYDALLKKIMEFTICAAVARSIDESQWEHEQLRRHGLSSLQIFRGARALWADSRSFEEQLGEAIAAGDDARFKEANESAGDFYDRLQRDLLHRWRKAGYDAPGLMEDMKILVTELESDAAERASRARYELVAEILTPLFGQT